jgi:two-component system, NtrC family, response regulator AtoC
MCIDRPSVAIGQIVREVLLDLTCAVRCDARVLITGDRDAGTRELAEMIHRGSRRAAGRFRTIDCAAATDEVLEARLFGRARGSAAGADGAATRGLLEQAHGGTLFLANVGAIGPRLQRRLLTFLEDGQVQRVGADRPHTRVDVRVISSADRDLFARAEALRFSDDLFYRLNVVHLVMPAGGRRDDVSAPVS